MYDKCRSVYTVSDKRLRHGGSGYETRRTVLLKGSDIKRTSRRTALLNGRNTRTIQLPLRHLKGIGIGMTPLSDWLNVLPRGSGIAWVTELPLPPKGMSWHVVLH